MDPAGPICIVDLRITMLQLVDSVTPTIRWLCVPSHTAIPGNERADALAEEGRVSSPLYQVLSLPERNVISLELPSTPTSPEGTCSPQVVGYIASYCPLS